MQVVTIIIHQIVLTIQIIQTIRYILTLQAKIKLVILHHQVLQKATQLQRTKH
jgi:hypothetical protein